MELDVLQVVIPLVSGAGGAVSALVVQWLRIRGAEAEARKAEADARTGPTPAQLGVDIATVRAELAAIHSKVERHTTHSDHLTTDLRATLERVERVEAQALDMLRAGASDQRDIGKMLSAIEGLHSTLGAIQQQVAILARSNR